jgi:predicted Zn-dependent protease
VFKLLNISLVAFVAVLLTSASVAHAHFLGYSSVDGNEIRWGGSTTYSTQWNAGISTWNALGAINIAPDTIWTIEDLTVSNTNAGNSGWTGLYTYNYFLADTIQLNTYYLSGNTSAQRQNTITHELGHSLGLAHSFSGNVMYSVQTSQTSLGTHDTEDYNALY